MLNSLYTSQFKKDYKLAKKQGKDINKLIKIIELLSQGKKLDSFYFDHILSGVYNHHRECHIDPDWLLIYKVVNNDLILVRLGSHSDLFK